LCLAKALTGGYTPLAATLTTERVYRAFWGPPSAGRTFFHGHSYTAHPLGAAVAVANLKLIQKTKLLEKTRQLAQIMRDELRPLEGLESVGSIRQAGLMAGIELVRKGMGVRVCAALLKRGFWLRPLGDVVVVMPPPVISARDLRRLLRNVNDVILHESNA
jgi:adenosylmethionine-8-amino-7-oxononanoate aminotransferase